MKTGEILENLEKVGLSGKEGEVFLELLKNPNSNGSQIAKSLGYPRTTVYQNLDLLEKKGYIKSYLDKEITYYEVIDLQEFLDEQKKKVAEATKFLKVELKKFHSIDNQKQFYNLNSLENIIKRIKQMLMNAEKKVFINTNIDLFIFKKEFNYLRKKGVKVTLFNFHKVKYEGANLKSYVEDLYNILGIEVYVRDAFDYKSLDKDQRIMLVVDEKLALIASNYEGDFSGTYSENKLLAIIVREHIVNDINLTRLEEKYGQKVIQETVLDIKDVCL